MIEALFNGQTLTVSGHSENDSRTCAAVSVLLWTLHKSYKAPEPTSGSFVWTVYPTPPAPTTYEQHRALVFVLDALGALAESYPDEVTYSCRV